MCIIIEIRSPNWSAKFVRSATAHNQEIQSCSPSATIIRSINRLKIAWLYWRVILLETTDMTTSRIENRTAINLGIAGLSSNRLGHQAFTLRIRVRVPLTLYSAVAQLVERSAVNRMVTGSIPVCGAIWCCRLAVKDVALSARRSRVQIPSAPPWEGSFSGRTQACGVCCTGSIPVLSPIFANAGARAG